MPETTYTKQDYLQLVNEILRHNELYYMQDNPEITDAEYDQLTQRLKRIESEHPDWVVSNSPGKHVGGNAAGQFRKVTHVKQLLSLNDLFSLEDVIAWHNNIGRPNVVVEQKIDGLTISLTYINNKFSQAATRGDGFVGEDVTEQAKQIAGIPMELPPVNPNPNLLTVRAEVCQPTKSFELCNQMQESLGLKPFANPRNCASGGLRAKDPEITKQRGLLAISFQIVDSRGWDDIRNGTQSGDITLLNALGFTPVFQSYCMTQEELLDTIKFIGESRPNLDYWIDGAVIKTDDQALQEQLGATSKYPLHAVAYKYPAEIKRTTIKRIVVQVGRTGVLAPVAEFEPVQLGGTTVSRATLHNQKFINERMLDVGAEIEVLKSGEIIPKVVGVPKPAKNPFQITHCPVCGTRAVLSADENGNSDTEVMLCPNMTGCPAQKLRYFEFFASRNVMDINGMGPSVIANLIDAGLLNNIWDIYDLKYHRDEIIKLDGIGEKKADSLLAAIEASKNQNIDRLIKALGIPGVGRHVGKILARRYHNMTEIRYASIEELNELDGIGEITAKAIYDFWQDPDRAGRYYKLRDAGVNTASIKDPNMGNVLAGMTFVITGTLPTMTRDKAKTLIENNGGKVSGSVSKKTTYLLTGDAAGSKLDKARNLGIPIISEDDLMNLLI